MTPIRASCRSSRGSAGWWTASRAIRDSSASLGAAMGSALGDWGWLMDVSSWSIASTLAEPQTRLQRALQHEPPEARALGRGDAPRPPRCVGGWTGGSRICRLGERPEALGWARARVSGSSAIHRSGGDRCHPRVLRTDAAVTAVRTGSDERHDTDPGALDAGTEPDDGRDHPDADPDADPTRIALVPVVGLWSATNGLSRAELDAALTGTSITYRRVLVAGSLSGATPSTPDAIRAAVNADARTLGLLPAGEVTPDVHALALDGVDLFGNRPPQGRRRMAAARPGGTRRRAAAVLRRGHDMDLGRRRRRDARPIDLPAHGPAGQGSGLPLGRGPRGDHGPALLLGRRISPAGRAAARPEGCRARPVPGRRPGPGQPRRACHQIIPLAPPWAHVHLRSGAPCRPEERWGRCRDDRQ